MDDRLLARLVGGLLITPYVAWGSGPGGLSLALGWRGWAMVLVAVFASLGLIAAFEYTYITDVAIIYVTVPWWLGAGVVRPRVRPRPTSLGMALVCQFGVGIIVSGGLGGGRLLGADWAGMTTAAAL